MKAAELISDRDQCLVDPNYISTGISTDLLDLTISEQNGFIWCDIKKEAPVCFTPALVEELQQVQQYITDQSFSFQVLSSSIPGVFSMGGDLNYFLYLIEKKDEQALTQYARSTIDLVHSMATGHKKNLMTIAAIDGQAYGGGFECALAADFVIATKDSKFALPEIMFNMVPGMGAYNLLCRKVSMDKAKKLIMSGKIYSANELLDMGIIDSVVEPDQLNDAVYEYMNSFKHKQNSMNALRSIFDIATPISKEEMYAVGDVWVEHAMKLTDRDKKLMSMFASKQSKIFQFNEVPEMNRHLSH